MHYTIKSSDLTQATLSAIQQRFGDAKLTIHIAPDDKQEMITEEECWLLINQLDWKAGENDDKIIAPLVAALTQKSIAHIYQFADWLAKKLWQLDTAVHAENLIKQDGFLSVDDFLYARCAVVANGEEYYNLILNQPSEFPTSVTFLPLLYTPIVAFQEKTKEEMVYVPMYNYETYGNKEAWGK